jgi:hypothetical protein
MRALVTVHKGYSARGRLIVPIPKVRVYNASGIETGNAIWKLGGI